MNQPAVHRLAGELSPAMKTTGSASVEVAPASDATMAKIMAAAEFSTIVTVTAEAADGDQCGSEDGFPSEEVHMNPLFDCSPS